MMGEMREPKGMEPVEELREIPKWTRRYAQNLTLGVVVSLVIFLLSCCAFIGLSRLTKWAYVNDKRVLAAASMVVLCGFAVFWLWFSFVGGVAIMGRITKRLYQGEGSVLTGADAKIWQRGQPRVTGVAFAFMFCVFASVGLGVLGFLPSRYMQPISAVYVVPFLVYLGLKIRPMGSPFMVLWPALYGIHAILDVAGVPVRFWGEITVLDMFVPVVGYGLVAALAGHVYSRIALRRLRALASAPEGAEEAEGQRR